MIVKQQKGFTIIELMIATAVFSTVLLLVTMGLLQVGRMYYKGITSARTQETARVIITDIAQNIQFNGGAVNHDDANGLLCVGNKRYSYVLDREVTEESTPGPTQSRHALVADDETGCAAPQDLTGATVDGRELVNTRMRLAKFEVSPVPSTNDLYSITIRIVSGDDTTVADVDGDGIVECIGERIGSQYCAASELSTTVQKRVN